MKNVVMVLIVLALISNVLFAQNAKSIDIAIDTLDISDNYVLSSQPIYENGSYVKLKKAYSINTKLKGVNFVGFANYMSVDDNNNLYVLDMEKVKISVFDAKGVYKNSFGKAGTRKNELYEPLFIEIHRNNIYVTEKFRGLKVLDLEGNYVDYLLESKKIFERYVPLTTGILGYNSLSHRDSPIIEFQFSLLNYKLKDPKNIVTFPVNKADGFFWFMEYNWSLDLNQNLFIPIHPNLYVINKYDLTGKLLLSFGREYNRVDYDKEILQNHNRRFGEDVKSGFISPLRPYPPIIRKIFHDSLNNTWVMVGQSTGDVRWKYPISTIVDIFDPSGKFMTSFETDKFTEFCFIKNNRLYIAPRDANDFTINVYEISYIDQ